MPKLALNFICKNERHIIHRMLESVRPVTDLIVAVDTGSTDKTIAIIKEFGIKHAIPTFVFERPFDNFGNSRNYALDKLQETVRGLNWDPADTWGFFLDCDEMMVISPQFKKDELDKDLFVATVSGEGNSFMRDLFFHLSINFRWDGPIHEILVWGEADITHSLIQNIQIHSESKGASWKGNLEAKFVNYANLLSNYVAEGHNTFRWVFQTGSSYTLAARYCKNKARKTELLSRAKTYYQRASEAEMHTLDERIALQRHLCEAKILLDDPWPETQELLLTAYSWDPRRAESIADVIKQLISRGRWHSAYLFSSFAVKIYHLKNPYGQQVVETEDDLYQWKLLLYHFISSWQTGRKAEAVAVRKELKNCMHSHPESFSQRDLIYIQSNSPFYLTLRKLRSWVNHSRSRGKKRLVGL